MSGVEISGNATDEESAAIAAVVAHVLSRDEEMLATPPPRPQQSDWVMAWRPTVRHLRAQPPRPLTPSFSSDDEG